jgi:hypothetical protein
MFFEASGRRNGNGENLRTALNRYGQNYDNWFDGSVGSIDARLAACARLLHEARSIAADRVAFLPIVSELEADQAALTEKRGELITGAQDREAYTPGESYSNHKFDSGDGGRCRWCKFDAKHAHHQHTASAPTLNGTDARWVELEAQRFVRDNSDADPRELYIRAANHARPKTGHLGGARAADIEVSFTNRCDNIRSSFPVMRTARTEPAYQDFDSALLYL